MKSVTRKSPSRSLQRAAFSTAPALGEEPRDHDARLSAARQRGPVFRVRS